MITGGAPGGQLCWSEPWMRFSARTAAPRELRHRVAALRTQVSPQTRPAHPAARHLRHRGSRRTSRSYLLKLAVRSVAWVACRIYIRATEERTTAPTGPDRRYTRQ